VGPVLARARCFSGWGPGRPPLKNLCMLDDRDRALTHALHIDGRAPFSRIAAVLDISPQTVARRHRRLRTEASLRVVGLPEPHRAGRTQ